MRCESCGQALTAQSDPLCGSCLGELRATSYSRTENEERQPREWMDLRPSAKPEEESAA